MKWFYEDAEKTSVRLRFPKKYHHIFEEMDEDESASNTISKYLEMGYVIINDYRKKREAMQTSLANKINNKEISFLEKTAMRGILIPGPPNTKTFAVEYVRDTSGKFYIVDAIVNDPKSRYRTYNIPKVIREHFHAIAVNMDTSLSVVVLIYIYAGIVFFHHYHNQCDSPKEYSKEIIELYKKLAHTRIIKIESDGDYATVDTCEYDLDELDD